MVTFPVVGSYSASKAAVNRLVQGARAELASQGTKVIGVYCGVVDTEMSVEFDVSGVPPIEVVNAALEAIIEETDDVFPDPMSKELRAKLLSEPKAVEQQFAGMLPS